MITMRLDLGIDASRSIQQVQINNHEIETRVQAGLDKAIEELSKEGVIEEMICTAAKNNLMDVFTRIKWDHELRGKIEKQIMDKLSARVSAYTDQIVNELSDKLNLPSDLPQKL